MNLDQKTADGIIKKMKQAEIELEMWQNNPTATNFSAQLFNLISKADVYNRDKIGAGFPEYIIAHNNWMNKTQS